MSKLGKKLIDAAKEGVAVAQGDAGSLFITHEKDGTVTVRARSAGAMNESTVSIPLEVWERMLGIQKFKDTLRCIIRSTSFHGSKVRDIARKALGENTVNG